jgi:EAL domain-containing protein (putative c-di-GMP-specific phosphodiesterase class I)
VLKINRAFVTGLRPASEHAALVDAMVSLGHALRLSVAAGGMETAEAVAQLRELGQGCYFARPLPLG